MWDLFISVPDHCLSFYFTAVAASSNSIITFSQISFAKLEKPKLCLPTSRRFIGETRGTRRGWGGGVIAMWLNVDLTPCTLPRSQPQYLLRP